MDPDRLADEQEVLLRNLDSAKETLLAFSNTLVVGIGIKETDGVFTDEISYRVFVRDKLPRSELSASEIIPPEIDGIKTDVVRPYHIKDRPDVCGTERETISEHRPLHAGIAISTDAVTYGTLGWFGILDIDDSRILLTNKHVLYDTTQETISDRRPVAQPQLGSPSTCCCCECGSDNVIGESLIGIKNDFPATSTSVDCAIARIATDHAGSIRKVITNDATSEVMSVTGTGAAVVGAAVRKIGARSGFTRGTVVHIGDVAAAATDPAGGTIAILTGQVLVIPDPAETYQVDDQGTCKFAFSNSGDSGSVIVNDADEIVALLYAGDETTNSVDITFANNIANVVQALSDNGFQLRLSATDPGERHGVHHSVSTLERRARRREHVGSGRHVLELIRDENEHSLLRAIYDRHHAEVLALVNHRRAVTVAWRRNEGPAYVAALARAARVPEYRIPDAVEGVPRAALLDAMRIALERHGSPALRADLEQYGSEIRSLLLGADTVEGLARRLHEAGFLDALAVGTLSEAR